MKVVLKLQEAQAEVFSRPWDASPGSALQAGRQNRPHILFIIDQICGLGGTENVLLNMIRLLSAEGFRCSVATFKIEPSLSILQEFPCPLHLFPLRRTYDWNALRTAARIWRLIRSERVTIVHTFFPTSNLWGGMVAKLSGCPVLVSSRRDMGILRIWKHRLAYFLMSGLADQVLAVSNTVRNFCIRQERLAPDKVLTLYNGVDLEKIAATERLQAARASLGAKKASHLIVTVANIRHVKGIDVFVRAAQIVHREFPDAVFAVIGSRLQEENNYFQHLRELIHSAGLTEHFKLLGPAENVFPVLKASDVFCLLSRSEGFTNALLEAMACGLPCVVTRVGGNPEAVQNGENGFLVEPEDAEGAADHILALLRQPELARKLGCVARETVEARFTLRAMTKNLIEVYESLLRKRLEYSTVGNDLPCAVEPGEGKPGTMGSVDQAVPASLFRTGEPELHDCPREDSKLRAVAGTRA